RSGARRGSGPGSIASRFTWMPAGFGSMSDRPASARGVSIRLVSVGSRGDVEPLVAVALELERLGHRVTVVCNGDLAEIPRAHGFVPYGRTTEQRSFYADLPEHAPLSALETHDLVQRAHVERLLPEVNRLRVESLGLPQWSVASALALREASPAVMGYSTEVL